MAFKRAALFAGLVVSISGMSVAAQDTSPETLIWCGLDYSRAKMIGTKDFQEPGNIFPGMLEAWNGLFMKEMLPKLERMAPGLRTDISAVQGSNAKQTADCIVREDGTADEMVKPTHITVEDITVSVKGYELKYKQGLGLVFIMDRLVKGQQTGCLYVVFFDIASRKVVYSERLCDKAGGTGFRNYWFNPVKHVVKRLPVLYQKAKSPR